MSTCNRLDLETLGFRPMKDEKNLLRWHCLTCPDPYLHAPRIETKLTY